MCEHIPVIMVILTGKLTLFSTFYCRKILLFRGKLQKVTSRLFSTVYFSFSASCFGLTVTEIRSNFSRIRGRREGSHTKPIKFGDTS